MATRIDGAQNAANMIMYFLCAKQNIGGFFSKRLASFDNVDCRRKASTTKLTNNITYNQQTSLFLLGGTKNL